MLLPTCNRLPQQPYQHILFMDKCMFGRHVEKEQVIGFLLHDNQNLAVFPVVRPHMTGSLAPSRSTYTLLSSVGMWMCRHGKPSDHLWTRQWPWGTDEQYYQSGSRGCPKKSSGTTSRPCPSEALIQMSIWNCHLRACNWRSNYRGHFYAQTRLGRYDVREASHAQSELLPRLTQKDHRWKTVRFPVMRCSMFWYMGTSHLYTSYLCEDIVARRQDEESPANWELYEWSCLKDI